MRVGVFQPDALDIHPLCRTGQAGGVMADELLGQLKLTLFQELQESFQSKCRHHWLTRLPSVSHLQNDGSGRRQHLLEKRGEPREPIGVFFASQIPVGFLRV